jgi:hypothetical protein
MDEAALATWRAFLNAHAVLIQRIETDLKAHELTGLVRLVDRLEAAGPLRREPVPEDRRGSYATITKQGTATLRKMWPIYRRHIQHDFLDPLGADTERLRTALEDVVEKSPAATPA